MGSALGCNVARIARVTGYAQPFVAKVARRLYDNGVWPEEREIEQWEETGLTCAFWRDVAVAEGTLYRRVDELGEVEWGEPGRWWKAFEYVDRSATAEPVVGYSPAVEVSPAEALIAEITADDDESPEPLEETAHPAPARVSPLPAEDLTPDWATFGWADVVDERLAAHIGGRGLLATRTTPPENALSDLFPDADWLS